MRVYFISSTTVRRAAVYSPHNLSHASIEALVTIVGKCLYIHRVRESKLSSLFSFLYIYNYASFLQLVIPFTNRGKVKISPDLLHKPRSTHILMEPFVLLPRVISIKPFSRCYSSSRFPLNLF